MAKHPDYVLKRNAQRGAITLWCPECKRKAALSQYIGDGISGGRKCRYCGHWEMRNAGERKKLFEAWLAATRKDSIIV